MPKKSATFRSKLESYVKDFGSIVLSTDGRVLFCKVCEREVTADKKFLVNQHVNGLKHKKLSEKKNQSSSSTVVQMIPFLESSGKKSQFSLELCDAFLTSNIPLRKLDNQKLSKFLEKWTNEQVPVSATLRLNYVKTVYDRQIESIRNQLKDKSIWISIDESTDACGRAIAHTVVGALEATESENFLLNVKHLEKTNSSTIAQAFMNSVTVLWPGGIHHDKVFLFLSDGAGYMKKAGAALKVIFPKMLHVTCVAHGAHRVAEEIRSQYEDVDRLVSNGKKKFLKYPARKTIFAEIAPETPLPPQPVLTGWGTWIEAAVYYAKHFREFCSVVEALDSNEAASIRDCKTLLQKESLSDDLAFIAAHFEFLPVEITRLEGEGVPLVDSLDTFENHEAPKSRFRGRSL